MGIYDDLKRFVSRTPEKASELEMIRPDKPMKKSEGMERPPSMEQIETLLERSAEGFAWNEEWIRKMRSLSGAERWEFVFAKHRLLTLLGCLTSLDEELLESRKTKKQRNADFELQYQYLMQALIHFGLLDEASRLFQKGRYDFSQTNTLSWKIDQREIFLELITNMKREGLPIRDVVAYFQERYPLYRPELVALECLEGGDPGNAFEVMLSDSVLHKSLPEEEKNAYFLEIVTCAAFAGRLEEAVRLTERFTGNDPEQEANKNQMKLHALALIQIARAYALQEPESADKKPMHYRSMSGAESRKEKSLRLLDGLLKELQKLRRDNADSDIESIYGQNVLVLLFRTFLSLGRPDKAADVRVNAGRYDATTGRRFIEMRLHSIYEKLPLIVRAEEGKPLGSPRRMDKMDWYLVGAIQVARSRSVFEKLSLDQWARYLQAFLEKKDHAALHECMRWVEAKEMRPFFSVEDWAEIVRLAKEKPVAAEDPFDQEKK